MPSLRDLNIWRKVQHDLLDWQYFGLSGIFQKAGHRLINQWSIPNAHKTIIEVGCGNGHHIRYGLNPYRRYIGLDIERKFLEIFRMRFPKVILIQGDAYSLPFFGASIDCVLSIYNFEHLRRLSASIAEIHRVLKPGGQLLVGLPLEGGILYGVGRYLTSRRYMQRKYGIDYDAIVQWEHCNNFKEILSRVQEKFFISEKRFIPFSMFPFAHFNVILCLRARRI